MSSFHLSTVRSSKCTLCVWVKVIDYCIVDIDIVCAQLANARNAMPMLMDLNQFDRSDTHTHTHTIDHRHFESVRCSWLRSILLAERSAEDNISGMFLNGHSWLAIGNKTNTRMQSTLPVKNRSNIEERLVFRTKQMLIFVEVYLFKARLVVHLVVCSFNLSHSLSSLINQHFKALLSI